MRVCTTQQQGASKLQASKPPKNESKNTQRECVFLPSAIAVHDQRE